jgi:hypothetical protein
VRKASKETWRTFCSYMKDLRRSARLHKDLSRGPQIKLGSLVAPIGERTQSERDILDLLLATHFPDSVRLTGEATSAVICRTKREDWGVAARIITFSRVSWAIDYFASITVQVWMEFSRLYCKRDGKSSFRTLSGFFKPAWRQDMFHPCGVRSR